METTVNKQLVEVHPHTCLVLWQAHCCLCLLHSPRVNRLTAARARDLVYVFTNGRLIEKMSNGEETFVDWEQEEEMEGGEE